MAWSFVLKAELNGNRDERGVLEAEMVRDACAQFANSLAEKFPFLDMDSSFVDDLGDDGAWDARDRRDPTNVGSPEERLAALRARLDQGV